MERIADIDSTIRLFKSRRDKSQEVLCESGEVKDGTIAHETKDQTLVDAMGDSENEQYAGRDRDKVAVKTHYSLSDFLARPVEIASGDLVTDDYTYLSYDVWDLFTLDPTIRSKLRNYAYIRADLHLRLAISGTPFHYGKVLVSYQPYPESNETLISLSSLLTLSDTSRDMFINYLSQSEGSISVSVNENKPVHMVCPFISAKDMHRLYSNTSTTISDITSYPDMINAGRLYIHTINPVKSASATPTNVHFRLYAWMENVVLSVPTATSLEVTTESGDIDEREVGPIEKYSSAASAFVDHLHTVPYIGPYATASKYILDGVASFASLFGWSVPVPIHEPSLVRDRGVFNGAQVIGYSSAKRITLDPKQELTIDPSCVGLAKDDMTIHAIASRYSFLDRFTVAAASSSLSWKCKVTPMLCTVTTVTTGLSTTTFASPTPMAFAASPFDYWRGSIKFRMEFVVSNYHRGKFIVVYEPNIAQEPTISTGFSTNKQSVAVIDLQDTQSVEFCVPWASPRSYLRCGSPTQVASSLNTDFDSTVEGNDFCNGFIYVYPFTEVQSPDGDGLEVNVWVKCDDLIVNRPRRSGFPTSRTIPTESGDITVAESCIELVDSTSSTEGINMRHFGESVSSFRSLLKRYVNYRSVNETGAITDSKILTFTLPLYPEPNATYSGTSKFFTQRNLFGYLRYAYMGFRGSIRMRVIIKKEDMRQQHMMITINEPETVTPVADASYTFTDDHLRPSGSVVFAQGKSPIGDFEVPFYTNNKFLFSFAEDLVGQNNNGEFEESFVRSITGYSTESQRASVGVVVLSYISTGEDFSFLRFSGAPFYVLA